MRKRNSYVSNSSSSSFILMETPALAGLTTEDWNDMIKELFIGYEKKMKEHVKAVESSGFYNHDWMFPFCAFDLRKERRVALKELGKQLRGWISHCSLKDGRLSKSRSGGSNENRIHLFEERLENEICSYFAIKYKNSYYTNIHWQLGRDGKLVNFRKGLKGNQKYWTSYVEVYFCKGNKKTIPIPYKYVKMYERKYRQLGVCDNRDVLENRQARFAVHFDENEYCNIRGIKKKKGSEWSTEEYSYERLCEVFARWLVKNKKVPNDFTWKDLYDATWTYNMHEG